MRKLQSQRRILEQPQIQPEPQPSPENRSERNRAENESNPLPYCQGDVKMYNKMLFFSMFFVGLWKKKASGYLSFFLQLN